MEFKSNINGTRSHENLKLFKGTFISLYDSQICTDFASYLDENQAGGWANSEDRVKLTIRPALVSSV